VSVAFPSRIAFLDDLVGLDYYQPLSGDFHGRDIVGGGFGFDAGDGQEVFNGFGKAAVAVDPVFLQGVDGFGGVGFGEFAVVVDSQFCMSSFPAS
jgi:hypothetical protein